ncbi:ABC transporter permease [Robertkochia marina]|uniref:ABC transporter permease n=1 Tax=Robertkochia marina TaxID=1227945 RepID=A0A4S3M616_9FLAO|nr:FtsX-like permease family protein [Robertkochia marina]THD69831.1 ABC transporter permease [Robertkochia marina]TRZ46824.1 ABC transporter permease [Robertkochia marina]
MINWKVILGISRKHLLSKFKSTLTATLGVTFGITAYITLVSFMTGLNQMLDNLILNQTPHIHIYNEVSPSKDQPITLDQLYSPGEHLIHHIKPKFEKSNIYNGLPLLNYLRTREEVSGATPRLTTQIFYLSGAIELGGNLTGINIPEEVRLSGFNDYIVEGSPEALNNTENGILLGAGLAKKMSLRPGDRLQVSNVKGEVFPLKVVGFYQSGIADIDNIQSYVNLKTAQRIVGENATYITDINVKLKDLTLAPEMARDIERQFQVDARDIQEANAQFETGTNIRNLITYAVSITLLIVAGFGIYNILNMLIYEKMNDIAILKATGFTGKDVQAVFMSQAMIIGGVGGVSGLIFGLILSLLINQVPFNTEALPTISTYPINFNPWYYLIGILFALLSTFIAGYLPSKKARVIDPVRIIRGN